MTLRGTRGHRPGDREERRAHRIARPAARSRAAADHGLEIDAPLSEWAAARQAATQGFATVPPSNSTVQQVRLAGRVLHLVDVENLNQGPIRGRRDVHRAQLHYEQHVLVGSGHTLALASDASTTGMVRRHWSADLHLAGRGADGADSALADFAARQSVHLYDAVVVGSGDHYFADLAQHCCAAGLVVVVVAPALGLSRELERSADRVVLLPDRFGLAA